ncbi:MAG: hypothetical protein IPL41_10655 [Micropruina sp.]|nr:hypothetical protein [Micropruina sp.]
MVAGGLCLPLLGCTASPPNPPAESASDSATPTAALSVRDQRIHDAINRRENVLTTFWGKPWDKRPWQQVSTGYLPQVERYQDRLNKAWKETDYYPTRDPESPSTVYAESGSLAIAAQRDSNGSESVSVFSWRGNELSMLFTIPWTHEMWMPKGVESAMVKPPAPALTSQLTRYWETGELPADVTLNPNGAPFVFSWNFEEPEIHESYSCEVYRHSGEAYAWSLPVEFGQLSLVAIDCRYRVRATGFLIGLPPQDADVTGNDKAAYSRLDCRWIYPMRVLVGDNGAVKWDHVGVQPMDVCTAS